MIKLYDRIKELSYIIGTGNITLAGAVRGFSTFSSCYSNSDPLFYTITDGTYYELGSGLYLSSSNEIKRFPVKSTNSNNLVNFSEGTKEVYVNYPATNSVFNTSGINPVPQNSGVAFWTSSNSLSYSNKFVIDSGKGRIGINKYNPNYAIDVGGVSSDSIVRSSGFFVGNSGVYFPSGNDGTSSYSGGIQFVHFEPNKLSSALSHILELSGIVNQNILLKKQNVGMVLAGPSGECDPPCDPDYPTFRYLVKEDLPEEISNLTIGDENSLTFLTVNLPTGLPNITYRDIGAISINTDSTIFQVNGLGDIKIGTIGYNQVTDLDSTMTSVSGTLNNKIDTVSGILNDTSGILNNKIYATSGILNDRITFVYTALNNTLNTFNSLSIYNYGGRLSLSSSDPTVDSANGSTLYFVPYNGNSISLYNGSIWINKTFQSSILVSSFSSLSPNKIYDIFMYLNNDDISFELVSWTMPDPDWEEKGLPDPPELARNIALTKFNNILCKSNNNTRRYIGTIRTGSTSFLDTPTKRFVYNHNNKITKTIKSIPASQNISWIYANSLTWDVIEQIPRVDILNGNDYTPSLLDIEATIFAQFQGYNSGYNFILHNLNVTTDDSDAFISLMVEDIGNPSDLISEIEGYANNSIYYGSFIRGDYQDLLGMTLKSRILKKQTHGHTIISCIQKPFNSNPVSVILNKSQNNYGIFGTYQC